MQKNGSRKSVYTDRLYAGREAVGNDDRATRRRLKAGQLESVLVRGQHLSTGRLRHCPAGDVIGDAADWTFGLAVREVRLDARYTERVWTFPASAVLRTTGFTRRARLCTAAAAWVVPVLAVARLLLSAGCG